MNIIDKQLFGSNLCNEECIDKNGVIHPETCASQVLTECAPNALTLTQWIDGDNDPTVHHGSFGTYHNLIAWLNANYPRSAYSLPIATYSNITSPHIGGIIVDPAYLTLSNSGVLSVNVSSLNIPSINAATFNTFGTVKLGNDTTLNNNFANTTITDTDVVLYPLRTDSNGHAGIAIPNSSLDQRQVDWGQEDISAVDYIKNKPTIPTVNNSKITIKQGDITKGQFTLNQSTPDIIVLDTVENYDNFTGATEESNGTNGLVPAPMISDRTKFLKGDGSWGTPEGNVYTAGANINISSTNVISANVIEYNKLDNSAEGHIYGEPYIVTGSGYDETTEDPKKFLREDGNWKEIDISYALPLANNGTRGGIQTGYVANDKNYPVELDNEKAFVHVPWTDTEYTLPAADDKTLGGIKTGYTNSGKNYKVQLDRDDNAYVHVNWENTTYSDGNLVNIDSNNLVNLDHVSHENVQYINSSNMSFNINDHAAYTYEISEDLDGNLVFYLPNNHDTETSIRISNNSAYTTGIKLVFFGGSSTGPTTGVVNTIVSITKDQSTSLDISNGYQKSIYYKIKDMVISIRHKIAYVYLTVYTS